MKNVETDGIQCLSGEFVEIKQDIFPFKLLRLERVKSTNMDLKCHLGEILHFKSLGKGMEERGQKSF